MSYIKVTNIDGKVEYIMVDKIVRVYSKSVTVKVDSLNPLLKENNNSNSYAEIPATRICLLQCGELAVKDDIEDVMQKIRACKGDTVNYEIKK